MHQQLIHTLKATHISGDVADELARHFQLVGRRNNVLLAKGRIASEVYFVDSGYVILESEVNGATFTRHIAKAGEFITVIESFMTRQPSKDILTRNKLYVIPKVAVNFLVFRPDKQHLGPATYRLRAVHPSPSLSIGWKF